MKFKELRESTRTCTKCKKSKPIKGGTTVMGKNFKCKECKEKKS